MVSLTWNSTWETTWETTWRGKDASEHEVCFESFLDGYCLLAGQHAEWNIGPVKICAILPPSTTCSSIQRRERRNSKNDLAYLGRAAQGE